MISTFSYGLAFGGAIGSLLFPPSGKTIGILSNDKDQDAVVNTTFLEVWRVETKFLWLPATVKWKEKDIGRLEWLKWVEAHHCRSKRTGTKCIVYRYLGASLFR